MGFGTGRFRAAAESGPYQARSGIANPPRPDFRGDRVVARVEQFMY
jgi:hypothetical protein